MAKAHSIGGIGSLYQVDAHAQPEDALIPKSHLQRQPPDGDQLAAHAAGFAQDWAVQARLIGRVYYNFTIETDDKKADYARPRGTLVPFGKEVQLRL